MEILENTSDYDRELERLDDAQKGIVRQLHENLSKTAGNKQKCVSLYLFGILAH